MAEASLSDPTPFADGRTLVIHFPAFTPRITFHENHTLTVEIIDGDNAGFRDTIPYRAVVRQKLVVLSWKEQVGSAVVHVLDREAGQTYSVVSPAKGGLLSLAGTIEWG
ncbi:MAG TPA: hypothetical protein VKQ32_10040 [Polyangia bacterium]|nr:hypothetical protein [Polyangia bacterium]